MYNVLKHNLYNIYDRTVVNNNILFYAIYDLLFIEKK